jgi:type I restriction enzyme S subunit
MAMTSDATQVSDATPRYGTQAYAQEVPPGYKRTDVGVIPEDWRVRALGTIGKFKNGINKDKQDFGCGFPFINLLDVFGVPKVSTTSSFGLVNSSPSEREMYALKSGDVLFVRSSVKPEGVGLTTLIPDDLRDTVFSGFLIRYRDNGVFALEFKKHCFWEAGFRARLIANSTVSANTNINQQALKSLQLAYPPDKAEQRAIAEALSDVDGLLGAMEALIAKKRAIKQATMQQLLTGKTRLPGFSGEWETKRLGRHVRFLRHGTHSRADLTADEPVRNLHYGDIHTSTDVFFNARETSMPRLAVHRAAGLDRLEDGDLVLVDASEDLDGVGKSLELTGTTGIDVVAGLHTIAARFDKSVLADGFKGYLQFCPAFRQQLTRLAAGTKVYATNRAHIASVEMSLPHPDEQTAIATVLSDMDAEIAALESRRDKTRAIKQGMMQQLLTGRVRLVKPEAAA